MRTYSPKATEIERAWFVVDADGLVLGRLASEVAAGKLKLTADGEPIVEPSEVRKALASTVKSSLVRIAEQALLLGAS